MSYLRFVVPTAVAFILLGTGCSDRNAQDSGVAEYEWQDIDQLLEKTRVAGEKRLQEEVARREESLQRDAAYRDRRDKLGERVDKLYDRSMSADQPDIVGLLLLTSSLRAVR